MRLRLPVRLMRPTVAIGLVFAATLLQGCKMEKRQSNHRSDGSGAAPVVQVSTSQSPTSTEPSVATDDLEDVTAAAVASDAAPVVQVSTTQSATNTEPDVAADDLEDVTAAAVGSDVAPVVQDSATLNTISTTTNVAVDDLDVSILDTEVIPTAAPAVPESTTTITRPNVMVVMVDDLDVMTFDTAVNSGLLPNIREHLIDRGVSFANSFVSDSLCCPSRGTFLTGQYPSNHDILHVVRPDGRMGVTYWTDTGADSNTLATWLQSAGYRTGLIGKYLNGYGSGTAKGTDPTYVPPGYDEWYGLIDPTTYQMYDFQINENGKVVDYTNSGDYQLDKLGEKAQTFLANADSRPFFLWLTPGAPHNENKNKYYNKLSTDPRKIVSTFQQSIRPPERYSYLKNGAGADGEFANLVLSYSVSESDVSDKHPRIGNMDAVNPIDKEYLNLQFKDRLGAMKAVDDMVGVAIQQLKDSGKYDTTVLVFTSDNGWMYGEHRLSGKEWAYEESIRVPLVISSPFHSARGASDRLVLNNDLAPTIVDLAGAVSQRTADGRSLVPLMSDAAAAWSRQRFFVEFYDTQNKAIEPDTFGAVREVSASRDEVYVNYFSDAEGLSGTTTFTEHYDLRTDPYQEKARNIEHAPFVAAVQAFAACSGASCQALEDARTPLAAIISTVADHVVEPGSSTGNIAFTVSVQETAAGSVVVDAQVAINSEFTGLAPIATVSGSGPDYTVVLTSATASHGSVLVTVTVTDGSGRSTQTAFTVNVDMAPTMTPIGNQTVPHGSTSSTYALDADDVDGDALTATVNLHDPLSDVATTYGLSTAAQYYNYRGANEKYLMSSNGSNAANSGWYVLMPTNKLYAWQGSMAKTLASDVVVDFTVAPYSKVDVYANPALMISRINYCQSVANLATTYGLDTAPQYFNYRGQNERYLLSSNGSNTGNGGWYMLMPTNKLYAWQGSMEATLASTVIADFKTAAYEFADVYASPALLTSQNATNDDPLVTVANPLYDLKVKHGLTTAAQYYNQRGAKEHYFLSSNGSNPTGGGWYVLFADNMLYAWNGSITNLTPIADFTTSAYNDTDVYATPTLLSDATLGTAAGATATITTPISVLAGGSITINTTPAFERTVLVTETVSDGITSTSQTHTYTVDNTAPTVASTIPNQTNPDANVQDYIFDISTSFADGTDSLAVYSVTVSGYSASYPLNEIQQKYGFYTANQYTNYRGVNETYFNSSNGNNSGNGGWYFMIDNKLYAWSGSIAESTAGEANSPYFIVDFMTTYGLDVQTTPSLLYDAAPEPAVWVAESSGSLYDVKTKYGLTTADLYFDYRGQSEKYFLSSNGSNAANGGWYVLMPTGELKSWDGVSLTTSPAVASLPVAAYSETYRLYATQGQVAGVTATVTSAGVVTLTRAVGFTDDVSVICGRSDGAQKTTQSFKFGVLPATP